MDVHPHDTPKFALVLALLGTAGVGLGLMAPNLFWVGAFICYLAAALTVNRYRSDMTEIAKSRKFVFSVERAFVVLVVIFEVLTPSYLVFRHTENVANLDYEIALRCLSFSGPIPVDPENPPYILGITGPIPEPPMVPWPVNVSTGFATVVTDDFRPKGAFFRSSLKCSVLNRSNAPIIDAFFEAGFHWHNLSPADSNVMLGDDISYLYRPFIVTSFDSDGKRADFYVVNFGPSGVTFVLPSHAQVHRAGNPKPETVKLAWLSRGKTEVVFPPKGMVTKYLPDSRPLIPTLRQPPERK